MSRYQKEANDIKGTQLQSFMSIKIFNTPVSEGDA